MREIERERVRNSRDVCVCVCGDTCKRIRACRVRGNERKRTRCVCIFLRSGIVADCDYWASSTKIDMVPFTKMDILPTRKSYHKTLSPHDLFILERVSCRSRLNTRFLSPQTLRRLRRRRFFSLTFFYDFRQSCFCFWLDVFECDHMRRWFTRLMSTLFTFRFSARNASPLYTWHRNSSVRRTQYDECETMAQDSDYFYVRKLIRLVGNILWIL